MLDKIDQVRSNQTYADQGMKMINLVRIKEIMIKLKIYIDMIKTKVIIIKIEVLNLSRSKLSISKSSELNHSCNQDTRFPLDLFNSYVMRMTNLFEGS